MKNASVLARLEKGILADCFAKIRDNFYHVIDENVHKKVYYGTFPVEYAEPEFTGKYLDICARYYETEKDERALKKAMTVVEGIAENIKENGHICSYAPGNELEWFGIWNHTFTLYGLSRVYEATGDLKVLSLAERAADFLVDCFMREGAPDILNAINQGSQHISCLHAMCRMYLITHKKSYLDFVEFVLSHCENTDMNLLSFRDILALRSKKGIEMLVVYLAVLTYGLMADKSEAVSAAHRYWCAIRDTQIRNTGNGTVVEFWTENGNAHRFMPTEEKPNETCVAVGWSELSLSLFFASPRAEYLDELERTVFNHMIGSLSSDGRDFAYYQGNYGKKIFRKAEGLYQCCRYRGYTLFSYLPSFMFYDDGENVIPVLYGASAYEKDGLSVEECTDYPADGKITFRIDNRRHPLRLFLRIPAWCEKYSLTIDGKNVSPDLLEGFLPLDIPEGKCELTLTLDTSPRRERIVIDGEKYLSFHAGPLLLALDTHFGGSLTDSLSSDVALLPCERGSALVRFKAEGLSLVDFASAGRCDPKNNTYTIYIKEKEETK